MKREYEIISKTYNTSITNMNFHDMNFRVIVKMSDTRYGSRDVTIAQFDVEEDAQIFIQARRKIEKQIE